jgi:hypothetical protein
VAQNEIIYRKAFAASDVGNSFSPSGPSLAMQVLGTGTAELQHTNTPEIPATWLALATQVGAGTATASTERAFLRVSFTGAGEVAVSAAGAKTGAAGGAGGGDASAANQAAQLAAANTTNARLPGATTAVLVDATAGAAFVGGLAAGACRSVLIENNRTGAVDIDVRRGASGGIRVVPAGSWALFDAVTNANELQIRRSDLAAILVTVSTELRT